MKTQATTSPAAMAAWAINRPELIESPGLVISRESLEHNLDQMVQIAGGPESLRPHVKTHKMREIVRLWLQRGVVRHKCATIAEAEMLASEGVADILLAYQLVGPNISRWLELVAAFPQSRFSSLIDHPQAAMDLGEAAASRGLDLDVLLDLNSGMDRTGVALNRAAIELYELIASTSGLRPAGLHWYDGHHRQPDADERRALVLLGWEQCLRFRDKLLMSGLPVPKIVAAGTGSFPILAETGEPNLELSPGTTVFFDADLAERFPEMPFRCALGIFTRVISTNGVDRLTLDVGHKACAADQPAGKRLWFPELPDAKEIQHSEEHLVVETLAAGRYRLGSSLLAIPRHACPCSAVHQSATVVAGGEITERWSVAARDRHLSY
jgi:D-serine deaminase-like pyridoxal phosphate-dependent protein